MTSGLLYVYNERNEWESLLALWDLYFAKHLVSCETILPGLGLTSITRFVSFNTAANSTHIFPFGNKLRVTSPT